MAVATGADARLRYLEGVVSLGMDEDLCSGCGRCAEVCPHGVFALREDRAVLADREACMECGACARNCPTGAVTVDAGVGCAAAVLQGMVRGGPPSCDCSSGPPSCCG